MSAFVVAIMGAESTGKTSLAEELARQLQSTGRRVSCVSETLRSFCERRGRTPRQHEQLDLAREHSLRIEVAAAGAEVVIADTTALMTAVYSEMVFADLSLYPWALRVQQRCGLNLVTALDLPWHADGIQRDGPHVREPVDCLLRAALRREGLSYSVIAGWGDTRVANAMQVIQHALAAKDAGPARAEWQWRCLDCDEPQCEAHLFKQVDGLNRLLQPLGNGR